MSLPRPLLVGAAAAHLTLAALFCTHVPIERELPAGLWRALSFYAAFTGAPRHYNFFAPNVSTQARAEFELIEPGGERRVVRLETDNGEVNQRLAMIFTFTADEQMRKPLLDSLASYMLARHPRAEAVDARLVILEIPGPQAARAGRPPRWLQYERLLKRRSE